MQWKGCSGRDLCWAAQGQRHRALGMVVEERAQAHRWEPCPKLFAQEEFKQMLDQKGRKSWAGQVALVWTHTWPESCSRTIFSGIMALCLWALKIPSYRTAITSLLMGMQEPITQGNSSVLFSLAQPFNLHILSFCIRTLLEYLSLPFLSPSLQRCFFTPSLTGTASVGEGNQQAPSALKNK